MDWATCCRPLRPLDRRERHPRPQRQFHVRHNRYTLLKRPAAGHATYSLLPPTVPITRPRSASRGSVTVTPTTATALSTAYWYGGQVPGARRPWASPTAREQLVHTGSYTATGLVPVHGERGFSTTSAPLKRQRRPGRQHEPQQRHLQRYHAGHHQRRRQYADPHGHRHGHASAIATSKRHDQRGVALGSPQTWTVASGRPSAWAAR